MSAWPGIPGPLFGPQIAPSTTVIRTEMDGGRPRQRQRFTQALWTYSVSLFLKDSEHSTFLTWWGNTIHQGADWFTISLKGPNGAFTSNARIVAGQFDERQADGGWALSMKLELDRPLPK